MYTFFFILASLRAATPWSSSANHMLTVQLLGRLNHHFWNNCLHHHICHDHTHHLSTYFKEIIAMAVGDIIFSLTLSFAIISNSGSSWTLPSWSRRYVWEGGTKMPQEAKYVRLREANLYYGVASSRQEKWSSQRVVALLLNPVNIEQLPKQVQVLVQIIELNWWNWMSQNTMSGLPEADHIPHLTGSLVAHKAEVNNWQHNMCLIWIQEVQEVLMLKTWPSLPQKRSRLLRLSQQCPLCLKCRYRGT